MSRACLTIYPELKEAVEGSVPYLIQRGKDPWFVVASGIMHGASVPYERQQRAVEEMVRQGPLAFTSEKKTLAFFRKMGAANFDKDAKKTVDAVKVFREACGDDGVKCTEARGQSRVMDDLRSVPGFNGPKIRALMWEYFGNEEAVAVDRHVTGWLCNEAKLLSYVGPKDSKTGRRSRQYAKGDVISDAFFETAAQVVRDEARRCKVTPAELQVAAWIAGACRPKAASFKHRRTDGLFLGEGYTIDCSKFPEHVEPLDGKAKQRRLLKPKERLRL